MEKQFERKLLFDNYHKNTNPFIVITVPIDVTKIVSYCQIHKHFYATMGYLIARVINQIDEFKWRYEDGEFHYYPNITPNFTQRIDNQITFFDVPYEQSYSSFIQNFDGIQNRVYQGEKCFSDNRSDTVWFSCVPWFSMQSLISPFDRDNTIPQFIWDRYEKKSEGYYMNLMIMVHHGFMDGYHIARFLELLKEEITCFGEENEKGND